VGASDEADVEGVERKVRDVLTLPLYQPLILHPTDAAANSRHGVNQVMLE
jgi:hypothetical protein